MGRIEQLELPLWEMLREATGAPDETDVRQLLDMLDETLLKLDTIGQLWVAAEAIAQIVQVFQERSSLAFEELVATNSDDGPVLPEDAFDRYVRQTMEVDFEQFIEPMANLPRKSPERQEILEGSIVGELDQTALLQVLDEQMSQEPHLTEAEIFNRTLALAHDEDVSVWAGAIAQWMQQHHASLSLSELIQAMQMPLLDVWLGVLLGDQFLLEQRGQFYDLSGVWISYRFPS
jgi:hypothetical protein